MTSPAKTTAVDDARKTLWTEDFEELCIRAAFQCFSQQVADKLAPPVWKDGIDINCLSSAAKLFICKVTESLRAQLSEQRTTIERLEQALKQLANEASGFRSMADRFTHGHTNMAVLGLRIDEARDLLATATPKPEPQSKPIGGDPQCNH